MKKWYDIIEAIIFISITILIIIVSSLMLLSCKAKKSIVVDDEKSRKENVLDRRVENHEADSVAKRSNIQQILDSAEEYAKIVIEEESYDSSGNVKNKKRTEIDYSKNAERCEINNETDSVGTNNNINVMHARDTCVEEDENIHENKKESVGSTFSFDFIVLGSIFVLLFFVVMFIKKRC